MSDVATYRVKPSGVVKAMRYDEDLSFDLDFLEPNEQVRLSSNGKSILITEKDTDRGIAFVDPGTWLVRKGAYIGQFDDEEFQRIYDAENPVVDVSECPTKEKHDFWKALKMLKSCPNCNASLVKDAQ